MSPPPLSNATSEHSGHESAEGGFLSELLYVKLQGSKHFSYPSIVLFPVKQQTGCVSWIRTFLWHYTCWDAPIKSLSVSLIVSA